MILGNQTDRDGYNDYYGNKVSDLISCSDAEEYIAAFEITRISPFYRGGGTKGFVRQLACMYLFDAADQLGISNKEITILDAGCGRGELSVYLACKGFNVIGVDISEQACEISQILADKIGVNHCSFQAASLDSVKLEDNSVDFVIGHASLHHFIKYENVAKEFGRLLRSAGKLFFADAFGENRIYRLFHNKEKMERLGDVKLTKALIERFFDGYRVTLVPTDWFVMLDKLFLKFLPISFKPLIRRISILWWHLDRAMPRIRPTLFLSGAVVTCVEKKEKIEGSAL